MKMFSHLQKAWRYGEKFYCTPCTPERVEGDTENHFVSTTTVEQHMQANHLNILQCASCGNELVTRQDK